MDALRGRRCAEDKLKLGVHTEGRIFTRVLRHRHTASPAKAKKCVGDEGQHVGGKNLSFVKILPVMISYCTVIVIEASERKNKSLYFRTDPRCNNRLCVSTFMLFVLN
jgi:hypothetical protein